MTDHPEVGPVWYASIRLVAPHGEEVTTIRFRLAATGRPKLVASCGKPAMDISVVASDFSSVALVWATAQKAWSSLSSLASDGVESIGAQDPLGLGLLRGSYCAPASTAIVLLKVDVGPGEIVEIVVEIASGLVCRVDYSAHVQGPDLTLACDLDTIAGCLSGDLAFESAVARGLLECSGEIGIIGYVVGAMFRDSIVNMSERVLAIERLGQLRACRHELVMAVAEGS